MILEETINRFVRDTIRTIAGGSMLVIKSRQLNAPRPSGLYSDVSFISDTSLGWEAFDEYHEDIHGDDVVRRAQGLRSVRMGIGFYRNGAFDKARQVRTGFVRDTIQDRMRAARLGLTARSVVRQISEKLESGFEERAQFDITFSAVGTDEEVINSICIATITGRVEMRCEAETITIERETQ